MKSYKTFAGLLFLLLLVTASSTTAYTPKDEGFVQLNLLTTAEDRQDIEIGNFVDFSIIVKNLRNDTISNITLVQSLPADTVLISVEDTEINGESKYISNYSLTDDKSGKQLKVSYLNATDSSITNSEFSMNFDTSLAEDEYFVVDFTMNFTTTGTFPFDAPSMTYYDHWGDQQTEVQTQSTQVEIQEIEEDTRTQYIPAFETTEPNYTILIGALLGLLLVTIFGRILHFKKPIEL